MEQYFKNHFQDVLGKTLRPFENKEFISLALDKSDPMKEESFSFITENFYVVPITLGEDPSGKLEVEKIRKRETHEYRRNGIVSFWCGYKI